MGASLDLSGEVALKEVESVGYNETILTVGTGVPDCVGYLLFSGEEKRSKKVAGDYYRDCVPG